MKRVAPFLLAALLACAASAQVRTIDASRGQLAFTYKVDRTSVEGRFPRFSAQLAFDEKQPEQGRIRLEVETAAIDTGSSDGDAEARQATWFDVPKFPRAVFESRAIRRTGEHRYEAQGELTIKGKSQPLVVPFTIENTSGGRLAQGSFTVRRLAFALGTGPWADTSQIADEVVVRFRLQLPA